MMDDLDISMEDRFEYSDLDRKPAPVKEQPKQETPNTFGLIDAQNLLKKYVFKASTYIPDKEVVLGDAAKLQKIAEKHLPNWEQFPNYKKDAILGLINSEGESLFIGDDELTTALQKGDDNMFLYRLMQNDTADRVRFGLYYLYNDKKLLNEII